MDVGDPIFRMLFDRLFGIWSEYKDNLCPPGGFHMVVLWVFPRSVFAGEASPFASLWFTMRWEDKGCSLSLVHSDLGKLWFGFYLVCKSGRSPSTNSNFTQPFPPNMVQKLFPLRSLPGFTLPVWLLLIAVAIAQNIHLHNLCIALCFEVSMRVHVSVECILPAASWCSVALWVWLCVGVCVYVGIYVSAYSWVYICMYYTK